MCSLIAVLCEQAFALITRVIYVSIIHDYDYYLRLFIHMFLIHIYYIKIRINNSKMIYET